MLDKFWYVATVMAAFFTISTIMLQQVQKEIRVVNEEKESIRKKKR